MKKAVAFCAGILLLGTMISSPAFAMPSRPAEAFTVSEYAVNAAVSADGSFDVDETIRVNFSEQKHGIYRTFPADGAYAVESVNVDAVPFTVKSDDKGTVVRIGDADTLVDGEQTYRLHYRLVRHAGLGSDDELGLSIVGADWDTTIDTVKFTVTLPKAVDASAVGFALGKTGSGVYRAEDLKYTVDGAVISGNTVRPLKNFEGLTMRLKLPQGYLQPEDNAGSFVQSPSGEVKIENPDNQPIYLQDDNNHVSVGGFFGPAVGILLFIGVCVVAVGIVLAVVLGNRSGGGAVSHLDDPTHHLRIDEENRTINDMNNMNTYSPPVDTGSPPGGSDGGAAGGGGGSSW